VYGITGWVDFSRDLRPQGPVIEAMTSTMVNRGPDAGGVWCSAHAAIGHRRLSVIDLEGGEQPMRAALRCSAEAEPQVEAEDQAAAYARDPRLTGFMGIQPSSTTLIAFLLDINRWLDRSGVTIRLDA
jgi:hypothetical protein